MNGIAQGNGLAIGKKEQSQAQSFWLVVAIPFALGTGLLPVLALALLGALFGWRKIWSTVLRSRFIGQIEIVYGVLLAAFLVLYAMFNTATSIPSNGTLSKFYFFKITGASFFMGVMPMLIRNPKACFWLLGALALGSFARGSASILLSFYYHLPLPFYGAVFDVSNWAVGNSPAVANMMALPVVFCAAVLANQRYLDVSRLDVIFCILIWMSAIAMGILLQSRLFVGISFVLIPVLLLLNAPWGTTGRHGALVIFLAIACIGIFYGLLHFDVVQRAIDSALISDMRFVLYKTFAKQMMVAPWAQAIVPPELGYAQFHNFFADVQRVSGTWAFLASVLLVLYILTLLVYLIQLGSFYGRFLLFLAIPCLLVMNTSVEPEGGGQNYLMLIAVGAVAAVVAHSVQRKACESYA